jgi:hypothetical protein
MRGIQEFVFVSMVTLTGLGASAHANDSIWVGADPSSQLSVRISPASQHVEVKLAPGNERAPGTIEIRFFDESGNASSIELAAIVPSNTAEIKYRGPLTNGSRPFVGFEIRIPFKKRDLVLSSRDLRELRRP